MTAPGGYTPSQVEGKEELVEVVARAIGNLPFASDTFLHYLIETAAERGVGHYDGIDDDAKDDIRDIATAAINAIREWEGR